MSRNAFGKVVCSCIRPWTLIETKGMTNSVYVGEGEKSTRRKVDKEWDLPTKYHSSTVQMVVIKPAILYTFRLTSDLFISPLYCIFIQQLLIHYVCRSLNPPSKRAHLYLQSFGLFYPPRCNASSEWRFVRVLNLTRSPRAPLCALCPFPAIFAPLSSQKVIEPRRDGVIGRENFRQLERVKNTNMKL